MRNIIGPVFNVTFCSFLYPVVSAGRMIFWTTKLGPVFNAKRAYLGPVVNIEKGILFATKHYLPEKYIFELLSDYRFTISIFWINFGQNYPISLFVEIVSENYPLGVAVHSVSWWAIHGKFLPDVLFFLLMSEQHMGCSRVSGPQRLILCALAFSFQVCEAPRNCSIFKCIVHCKP